MISHQHNLPARLSENKSSEPLKTRQYVTAETLTKINRIQCVKRNNESTYVDFQCRAAGRSQGSGANCAAPERRSSDLRQPPRHFIAESEKCPVEPPMAGQKSQQDPPRYQNSRIREATSSSSHFGVDVAPQTPARSSLRNHSGRTSAGLVT